MKKNLLDLKFGRLTILSFSHREDGKIMWNTICDCGKEKKVWTSNLTRGKIKSCGCLINKPDLVGQRFGNGVVIQSSDGRRDSNRQMWLLKCDCGNLYRSHTNSLRGKVSHRTTSCGCRRYIKGEDHHLYNGFKDLSGSIWHTVIAHSYMERRQIFVTKQQAYEIFEKQNKKCIYTGWDLSFGIIYYKKKERSQLIGKTASLDRIDSSKPYTIDNIQWVHKHINMMKNCHSETYFLELCNAVSNYRKEVELCE